MAPRKMCWFEQKIPLRSPRWSMVLAKVPLLESAAMEEFAVILVDM